MGGSFWRCAGWTVTDTHPIKQISIDIFISSSIEDVKNGWMCVDKESGRDKKCDICFCKVLGSFFLILIDSFRFCEVERLGRDEMNLVTV